MAQPEQEKNPVFNPGKARWLQAKGKIALDDGQKALLLALTLLEADLGRELSEEETNAIDALSDQLNDIDPAAIKAAVSQMLNKPADPARQIEWPDIKLKAK
ncbi:MAG: hypothetical protein P1S60_10685 [Anaerolineae bacterium]|nr:hypothetical protein [Anaerolineae bacterium]